MLQPQFKPHSIQQVLLRLFQVFYIINSSFLCRSAFISAKSLIQTSVQRLSGGGADCLYLTFGLSQTWLIPLQRVRMTFLYSDSQST